MTKKSQVRNLPRLQRQRVKFSNRDFWLDIMCTIQNESFLKFGAYICGNLAGIHPVQLRDFQKSAKNHRFSVIVHLGRVKNQKCPFPLTVLRRISM